MRRYSFHLKPRGGGGRTSTFDLVKVKGLKNPIKFDDLKSLLYKDSYLKTHNEKWYKSLSQGSITIRDEIYTLSVTENKRELIRDKDNIFIDTKPIIVNE